MTPIKPTNHGPGTKGKLLVMVQRAKLSLPLFHPDDYKTLDFHAFIHLLNVSKTYGGRKGRHDVPPRDKYGRPRRSR